MHSIISWLKRKGLYKGVVGVLFIIPYTILWVIFLIWPVIYGFFISLHEWKPLVGSRFIWFGNYIDLMETDRFWNALRNTTVYSFMIIPLILVFGLIFALLLHRRRLKGIALIESALFIPYLLNVSIISIIWNFLFDPDVGIINYYLTQIGINPPIFLNNPRWVLPAIAFATAWWLSGYRMVVFRAALQGIPDEFYEAASIDGAGALRKFFSITIPLLKPTMLFAIIITLIGGLRTFGQIILMTAGGPGLSSEVLALYMYRLGFDFLKFGQAAAVGFILFFIIFLVSIISFKIMGFESELR